MNPQQHLQLEDAQKKLALFRKHLELIARCTGESNNIQKDEILSAVAELQTLVEWAAQQPDLGALSAILLVKLQELNKIRENLETASTESDKTPIPEENDEESSNSQKTECLQKELVEVGEVTKNSCNNDVTEESVYVDKDSLFNCSVFPEDWNLAIVKPPENTDDINVEVLPSDDKVNEKDERCNVYLTKDQEIARNSEQSTSVNSEALQKQTKNKTEGLELQSRACGLHSPDLYRSEVVIIETDEENNSVKWINDPKSSNDPLDVCMYAIRNLYDSLRVKESELLKLSALQTDEKQIEALQAVIIDFHRDITNLNCELEYSKRENTLLKEQVLELEEAENDARLLAQKLEQKLIFLQEKDSHSQAELSQLKQTLKRSTEALVEKEKLEKELRSQIKYMETLVQKYEDQIKTIEAKEIEAFRNAEKKRDSQQKCDTDIQVKPETSNKGTQMYIVSQSIINRAASNSIGNTNVSKDNNDLNESQVVGIPVDCKSIFSKSAEHIEPGICSIDLTSADAPAYCSEQVDIVNLENIENISEKGLLKRLHKLIDEDVNLQQQIHYVDEINLAMWKKLQNLDNHIGECKRQNINETNPVFTDSELKISSKGNLEIQTQEQISTKEDDNIPPDSLMSLDQNVHYIQDRLRKLKEINASVEIELKTRENLSKEKEKKHEEMMETENRIIADINRLTEEKNWITNQINNLKKGVEMRGNLISKLEQEITSLKNKNQEQLFKIRAEQEGMSEPLILKVNQMLTKEKDILKMISNFKLKENRTQGKNELERLKCSYIELQLELSQAREEIRKLEEKFKYVYDQYKEKHVTEETQRSQELERIRNENIRCNKIIKDLEENQKDLINALEKQERYLQEVRENYETKIEEEEHHHVETELENQLRLIEEGAAIATTVLKEERLKAEKELQENIKDLKAKEEIYKAKIAELERNVMNLHEELHKITTDEEKKVEVQLHERISDEVIEKSIGILSSKPDILEIAPITFPRSAFGIQLKSSNETIKEITLQTAKLENSSDTEIKQCQAEENAAEDNVAELRAQVRELQSHIEKISEEVAELQPIQKGKSLTASSLNMQKEDIDYAEVEECCSEVLRKQNASNSNEGVDKQTTIYKDKFSEKFRNESKYQKEVSTEDNDYDEVLPRPTNFHVVQQVGADTLLVGWNYVNPSVLEGFEVYLDDQVHERIYIPDRTKALIGGLNLRKPVRLSICALSRYGQLSEATVLEIPPRTNPNTNYFDDEEDEYRDFEDSMKGGKRPYSMEW